MNKRCTLPPAGWFCSREENHAGPCAVRQLDSNNNMFYICSAIVGCVGLICYTIATIYGVKL